MIVTLEYTTLEITIHAKTVEAEADSILVAGDIIRRGLMLNWGRPNTIVKVGALCPQCKTENFLPDSLVGNEWIACSECGAWLKKELFEPCETEKKLKKVVGRGKNEK